MDSRLGRFDFKKSFLEKRLSSRPIPNNVASSMISKLGYKYEYEDGKYYIYNSYEWDVKKRFDKEVAPLLKALVIDHHR